MSSFSDLEYALEKNNLVLAQKICQERISQVPDDIQIKNILDEINYARLESIAFKHLPGIGYREWLTYLHKLLQPRVYLEIGIEYGYSLACTLPTTQVIGIDPNYLIPDVLENWKLYRLTSNEFFESDWHERLDFAFIDGMHTFDQALRDFINVEKYCSYDSVVAFHDTYPTNLLAASRERKSIFWTGDTWKIVLILLRYRKDLQVFTIPTYPSGLTLVRRMDNTSNFLYDNYQEILDNYYNLELNLSLIEKKSNVISNDIDIVNKILGN